MKINRKPSIIFWGNLLTWQLGFAAVSSTEQERPVHFASQRVKEGDFIGLKKFCRCGSYIPKLTGDQ